MTMTKRDLCEKVANETGFPLHDVVYIFRKILDAIMEALARGETLEFRNFGVFMVQTHKPKVGRNPRKPSQVVQIPERRVVKFKMGRIMKKRIMEEAIKGEQTQNTNK